MKKDILTKTWAVAAIAFVCCVLWGSAAPAIKTGYAHMGIASSDVASILVYAGVRFMIAGLMVLIFDAVSSRKIMRPDGHFLKMAFQLSLVQTAGQYFFFYIRSEDVDSDCHEHVYRDYHGKSDFPAGEAHRKKNPWLLRGICRCGFN